MSTQPSCKLFHKNTTTRYVAIWAADLAHLCPCGLRLDKATAAATAGRGGNDQAKHVGNNGIVPSPASRHDQLRVHVKHGHRHYDGPCRYSLV